MTDRKQTTKVNNACRVNNTKTVRRISQESILGPQLISIFMCNMLSKHLKYKVAQRATRHIPLN